MNAERLFEFTLDATSGSARAGTLTLPHGTVETPLFMPVGTQGTVRALSPNDLRAAGATMVLANTYHLHVRPGEHVVQQLGRDRKSTRLNSSHGYISYAVFCLK